jgi:hypothetical protein
MGRYRTQRVVSVIESSVEQLAVRGPNPARDRLNQAREIMCYFLTSYYKIICFLHSKEYEKIVILFSSAAVRTFAIDFETLP